MFGVLGFSYRNNEVGIVSHLCYHVRLTIVLGGSMFSHHWVSALSEIENRVVGIYFSGDGDLQPFSWAVYLCLGVMQIALSTFGGSPHFAFRTYQSNQWSEWQIIVGS